MSTPRNPAIRKRHRIIFSDTVCVQAGDRITITSLGRCEHNIKGYSAVRSYSARINTVLLPATGGFWSHPMTSGRRMKASAQKTYIQEHVPLPHYSVPAQLCVCYWHPDQRHRHITPCVESVPASVLRVNQQDYIYALCDGGLSDPRGCMQPHMTWY